MHPSLYISTIHYLRLVCLLNNIYGVLSSDKTVFIWGGVRALERLAVQLCAAWGARVTCVAPRYTHEYLLSLGAAHVVADDMEEVERVARSGQRWVEIRAWNEGPSEGS